MDVGSVFPIITSDRAGNSECSLIFKGYRCIWYNCEYLNFYDVVLSLLWSSNLRILSGLWSLFGIKIADVFCFLFCTVGWLHEYQAFLSLDYKLILGRTLAKVVIVHNISLILCLLAWLDVCIFFFFFY